MLKVERHKRGKDLWVNEVIRDWDLNATKMSIEMMG